MIVGIGCDIVEIDKTLRLGWKNDDKTLKRIFSKKEIASAPKLETEKYYSSRFAIKEAILKCLGAGMEDGIALNDIEIHKINSGGLQALLKGQIKKIADSKNITHWYISLSHSKELSSAFVIAENQDINLPNLGK